MNQTIYLSSLLITACYLLCVVWTSSCVGAVAGTVLLGCGSQPLPPHPGPLGPGKRAGAATIWLIGQLRQCTVGKLTGHITIHSEPNCRWRWPQNSPGVFLPRNTIRIHHIFTNYSTLPGISLHTFLSIAARTAKIPIIF